MENKNQGLEGVVAATTRLSSVDGEAGVLLLAGFPVEEIAPRASFEELTWLLWNGTLPTAGELEAFARRLPGRRPRWSCCARRPGGGCRRWTPCAWPPAPSASLKERGEIRRKTPSC